MSALRSPGLWIALLAVALLAAVPAVTGNASQRETMFIVLQSIALASSLNILLGLHGLCQFRPDCLFRAGRLHRLLPDRRPRLEPGPRMPRRCGRRRLAGVAARCVDSAAAWRLLCLGHHRRPRSHEGRRHQRGPPRRQHRHGTQLRRLSCLRRSRPDAVARLLEHRGRRLGRGADQLPGQALQVRPGADGHPRRRRRCRSHGRCQCRATRRWPIFSQPSSRAYWACSSSSSRASSTRPGRFA